MNQPARCDENDDPRPASPRVVGKSNPVHLARHLDVGEQCMDAERPALKDNCVFR
jgi:hypothetical protein